MWFGMCFIMLYIVSCVLFDGFVVMIDWVLMVYCGGVVEWMIVESVVDYVKVLCELFGLEILEEELVWLWLFEG